MPERFISTGDGNNTASYRPEIATQYVDRIGSYIFSPGSQLPRDLQIATRSLYEAFRSSDLFNTETARFAGHLLARHNYVTQILASPEYKGIASLAARTSPDTFLGIINCIDGRDALSQYSGDVLGWSVPGGLLTLRTIDGQSFLASGKLKESLTAQGNSGQEIVEVLKTHTSLQNPIAFGCLAMREQYEATYHKDPEGFELVDFALTQLGERTAPMTRAFNVGRQQAGLPALRRITVLGVQDTDTNGLILQGNGESQPLNTVDIVKNLWPDLHVQLAREFGQMFGRLGFMKESYQDPQKILEYELANFQIVNYLAKYPRFNTLVTSYVAHSALADLTDVQKIGLRRIIARKVANHIMTNTPFETDHLHTRHREAAGSISIDGAHIGDRDPGLQMLTSSPANNDAAAEQARTQIRVLTENNGRKPNVLFVVSQTNGSGPREILSARGASYELFTTLAADFEIQRAIKEGKIVLIPTILDENKMVIEVPNPLAA